MEKKKIIYIAGPITGVDKYWEPFEKADDDLTSRGYAVLNPTTLPKGLTAIKYTSLCWAWVLNADAVLFLPGWEYSMGASAEWALAVEHKKPVYYDIKTLCEEVPAV